MDFCGEDPVLHIKYTGMGGKKNPSASDSLKDKNIHVSVCGAKACIGDKYVFFFFFLR